MTRRKRVERVMVLRRSSNLQACRSTDLKRVLDYMIDERMACDQGIDEESAQVFDAVCLMLDCELRFRSRRRRARVIVDGTLPVPVRVRVSPHAKDP